MTIPAILRPAEAADFLGISKRYVYILAETDPTFPRKLVFGRRCVGWRRDALEAWLEAKAEGADCDAGQ